MQDIIDVEILPPRRNRSWIMLVGGLLLGSAIAFTFQPSAFVLPVPSPVQVPTVQPHPDADPVEPINPVEPEIDSTDAPGCAIQQVCALGKVEAVIRKPGGVWVVTGSGTYSVYDRYEIVSGEIRVGSVIQAIRKIK
ncbi:hypothetical protein ACQ4M3_19220 [Leptolyngbya sp. AN03gr2]|uniref:hypothetical protein n=1 Tax=Leptolyngbya sp. AN03gr2 TaxID=3423364 RepID=UPI003D31B356